MPMWLPAVVGQTPGTQTSDLASSGNVGEYIISSNGDGSAGNTVTITIATPAVVTWTGNAMQGYVAVKFATTGALPTGIVAGTIYYTSCPAVAGSFAAGNNFKISTTLDNAIAGIYVNTSGTQSGVQTLDTQQPLTTGTNVNLGAISLPPGDWDVSVQSGQIALASTTVASSDISVSPTSLTRGGPVLVKSYPYTGTANNVDLVGGPARISVAVTTTYYGVFRATFAVSTMVTGFFMMRARRIR